MALLFKKDNNGWPTQLLSSNYNGPTAPDQVVFETWDAVDQWKDANPGKRPQNAVSQASTAPEFVELWQLRTILDQRNIMPRINAYTATLPEPPRIALQNAIEYMSEPIDRNWPILSTIAHGIGLTEAELDDIFRCAQAISIQ